MIRSAFSSPEDGDLLLEPLREDHRAALKAVCAEDAEIWQSMASATIPNTSIHRSMRFCSILLACRSRSCLAETLRV